MKFIKTMKYGLMGLLCTAMSLAGTSQNLEHHNHHNHQHNFNTGRFQPICTGLSGRNSQAAESPTCFTADNIVNNPDRYKLPMNFMPNMGQPVKVLRINVHSVQNSTVVGNKGNFENTPAEVAYINLILDKVEDLFETILVPYEPVTCVCGTECYVPDTRIRMVRKGIHFDYAPQYYGSDQPDVLAINLGVNNDTEINLFFAGDNSGTSFGGNAVPPVDLNSKEFDNLNRIHGAQVANYHKIYESGLANGDNMDWWATVLAHNLYHEIIHNLGLYHLYDATGWIDGQSSPSFDFLDDFRGTGIGSCDVPLPNIEFCSNSPNDPDDGCSMNVMGGHVGFGTAREMTPKQLSRIHRNSMLTSARKYFDPTSSHLVDHEITGTETWDFSIRMFGDIRVKSGGKLTIRCEVLMPPGSEIFVEEGGMLIIDGGTITDIEGHGWNGIVADGDASKTQWPVAVNGPQGIVLLRNNAVVENASKGISAPNGGVVQAIAGKFLNNDIDVEFGMYTNKYPSNAGTYAGLPAPNISYFTNCEFITNKSLHSGNQPQQHLGLHWVDGIRVNYCTFENTLAANYNSNIINRGIGILCQDATVKVTGKCNLTPPLGSPCLSFDKTEFLGLAYGIHASSAEPHRNIDVSNALFDDTWRGIYVNGMDHSVINQSEFRIDDAMGDTYPFHPDEYNYGIYIRGSRGFEIEENEFNTSSSADFGIYAAHTNVNLSSTEQIYLNKFDGMDYAVHAHGRNDGLLVKCNDFDNSKQASIAVASYNGRIASPQGTCTSVSSPAGNAFDLVPCGQFGYDLLNGSSSYLFSYTHHSGGSAYVPNCDWNVNTYSCNSWTYNASTSCPSNIKSYYASDLLSEVHDLKADQMDKVGRIINGNGTIGTGNSAYLLGEIETQTVASSLMEDLGDASPYLSDAVLVELVTNTNSLAVLSSSQITSVLIDNSPLTSDVMSTVTSMNPSLDADDMSDLQAAQTGESARSVLEASLLEDTREMQLITDRVIRRYNTIDSLPGDTIIPDSVFQYLDGINNDWSGIHADVQVQMACYKLASGDLTGASSRLTSFENTTNNNNQSDILQMVIAQRQLGQSIYDVTGSDLTTLMTIAGDVTKHGHSSALGILAQIDENIFSEEFELASTGNKKEIDALTTNEAEGEVDADQFKLFPNPNNGTFELQYPSSAGERQLEIYDLKGVLIYSKILPANRGQVQVHVSDLSNGVFVYRVLDSGATLSSGKLVVQGID